MPTATLVLSDIDSGSTTITNDTSVKYELSFSDGVGSGVTKIEIYGDYITTHSPSPGCGGRDSPKGRSRR